MTDLFLNGWALWVCAWQSLLVLALGLLLAAAAKRLGGPAGGHAVLSISALFAVILPFASIGLKLSSPSFLHAEDAALAARETHLLFPLSTQTTVLDTAIAVPAADTARINLGLLLTMLWIAGAVLLLLRTATQFALGVRLLSRARPLVNERLHAYLLEATQSSGRANPPVTFTTDSVHCPAIWCWSIHPSLLLPPGIIDRADVNWRAVFAHELAHLRRRDHMTAIAMEIVTALLFWNPLVWLVRRRLDLLSDMACDSRAVGSGIRADDYAEVLLSLLPQRRSLTALSMVSGKKNLRTRLDFLLTTGTALRARPLVIASLSALLMTALSAALIAAIPAEYLGVRNTLVSNSGMERGSGGPADWLMGANLNGVHYLHDHAVSRRGTSSIAIRKTANNFYPIAEWSQLVHEQVPADARTLNFSAWVKSENVHKSIIDIQFTDENDNWTHEWLAYIGARNPGDAPAQHDWKLIEGSVPIPEGTTSLTIALQMYGPGTVWFDDVSANFSTNGK
jgi:beta-lactamase regulating signal transducer with metallopeptidase domain